MSYKVYNVGLIIQIIQKLDEFDTIARTKKEHLTKLKELQKIINDCNKGIAETSIKVDSLKYAQYAHCNNFQYYLSHGCRFETYKDMLCRLYARTTKKELDLQLKLCIEKAKEILNGYLERFYKKERFRMVENACLREIISMVSSGIDHKYQDEKSIADISKQIYAMFEYDNGYANFTNIEEKVKRVIIYAYLTNFHITKDDFGNLTVAKINMADIL